METETAKKRIQNTSEDPPGSDPPLTPARQVSQQEKHPRSPSMPARMTKDLTSAISKLAERSEEYLENCSDASLPS
jgi:hypothetical protein